VVDMKNLKKQLNQTLAEKMGKEHEPLLAG
jgi:hypothetical protein